MIQLEEDQFVSPEIAYQNLGFAILKEILEDFKANPLIEFPYIMSSEFEYFCKQLNLSDDAIFSYRYTCLQYYKQQKAYQDFIDMLHFIIAIKIIIASLIDNHSSFKVYHLSFFTYCLLINTYHLPFTYCLLDPSCHSPPF